MYVILNCLQKSVLETTLSIGKILFGGDGEIITIKYIGRIFSEAQTIYLENLYFLLERKKKKLVTWAATGRKLRMELKNFAFCMETYSVYKMPCSTFPDECLGKKNSAEKAAFRISQALSIQISGYLQPSRLYPSD